MIPTRTAIILVLIAAAVSAWAMHKYLTCEPCRVRRAALLRALGLRLIE